MSEWTMRDAALDLCRVEADRWDQEAHEAEGTHAAEREVWGRSQKDYAAGIASIYRWIDEQLRASEAQPAPQSSLENSLSEVPRDGAQQ